MPNDYIRVLVNHDDLLRKLVKALQNNNKASVFAIIGLGYLLYRLYKAEKRIEELELNRRW